MRRQENTRFDDDRPTRRYSTADDVALLEACAEDGQGQIAWFIDRQAARDARK